MSTRTEDADYWGLSPTERSRWLGRISAYHARRAVYWSVRAQRGGWWAVALCLTGLALAAASLALQAAE